MFLPPMVSVQPFKAEMHYKVEKFIEAKTRVDLFEVKKITCLSHLSQAEIEKHLMCKNILPNRYTLTNKKYTTTRTYLLYFVSVRSSASEDQKTSTGEGTATSTATPGNGKTISEGAGTPTTTEHPITVTETSSTASVSTAAGPPSTLTKRWGLRLIHAPLCQKYAQVAMRQCWPWGQTTTLGSTV